MKRTCFYFFLIFLHFSVAAQRNFKIGLAPVIEYNTIGDKLGYGLDADVLFDRFYVGVDYLYSSDQRSLSESITRVYHYTFSNHLFSIPLMYRIGDERRWEAGVVYSYLQSKVDYFDFYPGYYKYSYKGDYIMQFAGLQLNWRFTRENGFYIHPGARFSLCVNRKEKPDEKITEFYTNTIQPSENLNYVLSYLTFRFSVGFQF